MSGTVVIKVSIPVEYFDKDAEKIVGNFQSELGAQCSAQDQWEPYEI